MNYEYETEPVPRVYERAIGSKTGIVDNLSLILPRRGGIRPNVTIASRSSVSPEGADEDSRFDCSGKGLDRSEALLTCIGEVFERHCHDNWSPERSESERSLADISGEYETIDFEYLDIYESVVDDSSLALSRTDAIDWTICEDFLTNEPLVVPTGKIAGTVSLSDSVFFPTTNGCAAGPSLRDATRSSIVELVERDAFMRYWCERRTPDVLEVEGRPRVNDALDQVVGDRRFDSYFLALDNPFDLPIVCCVVVSDGDTSPLFTIGCSAGTSYSDAMVDALLEAGQGWVSGKIGVGNPASDSMGVEDVGLSFDDGFAFYNTPEHFSELAFLLEGEHVDRRKEVGDLFETVVDELVDGEYDVVVFDLTTADVRELRVSVVKTVIPELVPLAPPAVLPSRHPAFDSVDVSLRPHPFP